MKAYGYVRVSTTEQARSGLGLSAQRSAIKASCVARGWGLVRVYSEQESGTVRERSMLEAALAECKQAGADGALVVAKLDRLTRSLAHLSELLDRSQAEGWALVSLDFGLDTSTEAGRLVARIMGAVAQFEHERISVRISEALKQKYATGWRAGGPVIPDDVRAQIQRLRDEGQTYREIAATLEAGAVPTARGGKWQPATVFKVLGR